ncbi:MAG: tetratricopeptide repeat protein, partial [Lachnospiraceae bacterium]|nr:tetratricopeptide repeat protein [Lachnospiraceae bacterium]
MVTTARRLKSLSNRLYNDGLEKAGIRDMTGAVSALREALKCDKNNIDARNLLGLVYYETGEVVMALSEWVISKNLKAEDNLADYFMDSVQSSPAHLEEINQTIKKFNIALNYCHQDSLDLAVIQLKKVLSLNSRFVKAHLLLALLYLNNGRFDRAKIEAQKALKLDSGSVMARRYLKEADSMLLPGESGKLVSDVAASES